jgi:hypothetical protein
MPIPPHTLWLDHYNCTWLRVQVMNFLIMQFSPIPPHFILVQILSSPPCYWTSVYVLPLMSETKLHTHAEPQAKLYFSMFSYLGFYTKDEKTRGPGLNGSRHYPNSVSS